MSRVRLRYGLPLLLCAAAARAQTGSAPVLTARPSASYPAKARTANVSGEAVVAFSIDASGGTTGVHAVSGPELLTQALRDEIRGWRFVTPLPRGAEKDFVADYTYSIVPGGEQTAMGASQPRPAGAGYNLGPVSAVSGVVRSADNRQFIDATPRVKDNNN